MMFLAAAAAALVNVFVSGQDGYHTYRIPSLVATPKGTVLAFCEGRKLGGGDSGDIDLLVKKSGDNGKTWSQPQIVWDDAGNTCGNPCTVVDRDTGTIWLLTTWNRGDDHEGKIIAGTSKDTRRVFVTHSKDDGETWATPVEITSTTKLTNWTWYATGPGAGIQIEHGPHKGRLVIPCDHIEADTKHYYSHVIYSDDHGKTWKLGGSTPQHKVNECEVVELTGGKLMLNMRNYDRTQKTRQVAFSDDGGLTWRDQRHATDLIEPICQASIHRLSWPDTGRQNTILFSNPASTKRERMTVRFSHDDGQTWPVARVLHEGPSAYSSLTVLPDGAAGCLFECGEKHPYEKIALARIEPDSPSFTDVFVSGQDGFHTYRIPSVIVTKGGTVLAFAEGRKTRTDQSENKIVLKRSTDGGATWGTLQLIADGGKSSLNNPCAVVEQKSGRMLLMYQLYPAGVHEFNKGLATGCQGENIIRSFLITSDDNGKTWSAPRDVTCDVKSDYATTLASGPGIGIQLTRGPHAGRILIPINEGPPGKWNVYAAFSDDAGKSWKRGGVAPGALYVNDKGNTNSLVNEMQFVELSDGAVMLNSRSGAGHRLRKVAVSTDGGATWSKISDDAGLREPRCMASVLRYSFDKSVVLFSNPDSWQRENGTIRASFDEGKTWPVKKVLEPGKFAYSCLTKLPDGSVGCFYETGTKDAYERIVFARFPLSWLTK